MGRHTGGEYLSFQEITHTAVVVRILASLLLGGVIGLEREMKNRPAGLRTYMLVCVGSCLIMMTNLYIYQGTGAGDPTRLSAQVVSGIGFLGAGTIVVTRRSQIKGLTTAAGLWASAAAGLALGVGFYEGALIGGASIFLVLTVLQRWDHRMRQSGRYLELYVELREDVPIGDFLGQLRSMQVDFTDIQLQSEAMLYEGVKAFTMTLKSRRRQSHVALTSEIRRFDGVECLEEL